MKDIFTINEDLAFGGFWYVVYRHGFTANTLWLIYCARRMQDYRDNLYRLTK